MLSPICGLNEGGFRHNIGMPKTPISQILRKNLEPYFEERGAQQRMAAYTKLSVGTISEIRNGAVAPQIDTLEKIADYLGVMVWELLLDSEESKRKAWSKIMSNEPKPSDFLPPANQPMPPTNIRDARAGKGVAARRRKKSLPNKGQQL